MSTLIITRRLYLIARYVSSGDSYEKMKRRHNVVEWTLGLIIPTIVAGPLYYVVQRTRFVVIEGFGCTSGTTTSILTLLVIQLWYIVPPLLAITFYYPSVLQLLYHQSRALSLLLDGNDDMTRTNYFRILILASIDILLTLPLSTTRFVLAVLSTTRVTPVPFYPGWEKVHRDWTPISISWEALNAKGTPELALVHYGFWISPVFALVFCSLFGLTTGILASYWRIVRAAAVGWRTRETHVEHGPQSTLSPIRFDMPPQESSLSISDAISFVSNSARFQMTIPPGLGFEVQTRQNEVPDGLASSVPIYTGRIGPRELNKKEASIV